MILVGTHNLDTVGVVGSIPIAPTISPSNSNNLQPKSKASLDAAKRSFRPQYATINAYDDGKIAWTRCVTPFGGAV